jgi:hypothetical protein
MCGNGIQAQPKLDVEDVRMQLLLYERDTAKFYYEGDVFLRHKNRIKLEMIKIKAEGYLPILVEYVQRRGRQWDEAQRWLKAFDLVPEDLSPMEFCKLTCQTPRGRIS